MSASVMDDKTVATRLGLSHAEAPYRTNRQSVGAGELAAIIRRRWRLVFVTTLLGFSLAALAAYEFPRVYTARAALVLEGTDPNLFDDADEAPTETPDGAMMDTEADMIRSRSFIGRVVDELNLISDPRLNTYLPEPMGTGSRHAEAGPVTTFAKVLLGSLRAPDEAPRSLPHARTQRDRAITVLTSKLSVSRTGESFAMNVYISDEDPRMAAELANAVASLYVEWSRDLRLETITQAVDFLRDHSKELAENIANTEQVIADYSTEFGVSSDSRDDLLRASIETANEQLSLARADLAEAEARVSERRTGGLESVTGDPVLSSELLTRLRVDEAVLMGDRAKLAQNFGPSHPRLLEADAKLAGAREQIQQEIDRIAASLDNDVRIAKARISRFEAGLADAERQLRRRALAEIRLRELNRDLLTEQKLHDIVSSRLGKLDPYSEAARPGVRIVSTAEVPTLPSFPKVGFLLAGGTVGALFIGFMMALTLESVDTRVRSADDAAQILRVPVLASVPRLHSFVRRRTSVLRALLGPDRLSFGEAFRALYFAFRRESRGRRTQVVLVTSSLPREGKTTASVGLAATAALDGCRTVLLDLDPNERGVHWALGLDPHANPLEDYLAGGCGIGDVLHVVPELPNLDVISAGSEQGDRGHVDFARLEKLVAMLRGEYEFVVIDTPPLLVMDDAIWLSASADSVLIVVSAGETRQEVLAASGERLRRAEAPLVGAVLNRAGPSFKVRPSRRNSARLRKHISRSLV